MGAGFRFSMRSRQAHVTQVDTRLASWGVHRAGRSSGKAVLRSAEGVVDGTESEEDSLKEKRSEMTKSGIALDFQPGDYVVYPKHGVGRVIDIEEQEIAGTALELYVVRFEKERMTLKVPTNKAKTVGMRRLSNKQRIEEAFATLKGKARIKRAMWSRRAQEYEAKINSGDIVSIAEVVRDLHRGEDQPEQSYSERQIYEAALGRLARELAAVEEIDEKEALKRLEKVLMAA